MAEILSEVATAPVKAGKRWRVKIATPGQGSSGMYSPEVLETYGPNAIRPGTKAFLGHAKPEDRSLRDLVGSYPEGAYWSAEENALFADLEPATLKWAEVLNELGPLAEASINVAGTKDKDGNVLTLEYHRANSVDLVAHAGLEGSGLQEQIENLVESARAEYDNSPGVNSASTEKDEMDNKELVEAFNALKSLVESFIAENKSAKAAEAQAEADAGAIETAVQEALNGFAAKVALIEAAEILPSQRASILEAAKRGEDVAPLIESAKTIFDEAKTVTLNESSVGRRFAGADDDFQIAGVIR